MEEEKLNEVASPSASGLASVDEIFSSIGAGAEIVDRSSSSLSSMSRFPFFPRRYFGV